MAIQNVSGIQDILNRYDSKSWTKSAELKEIDNFKLDGKFDLENVGGTSKSSQTFGEFLSTSMNEVNNLQHEANTAVQKLVTGESKNIHETMLSVEKAEIAFKAMNQVRQKVIDAYREIMRMQI